jgi:hypothetical protein
MGATILQSNGLVMDKLLAELAIRFPELSFIPGRQFYWSPETEEVVYAKDPDKSDQQKCWSLLHETGHGLLRHCAYHADFELIRLEVAAWEKARLLAREFQIEIDENHIQDCLDTYRDWLYKRSICPSCTTKCLQQQDFSHYRCFNCHAVWRVTPSRFCRSYRSTKNVTAAATAEVFHLRDLV